jgi:hypothetical protein
LQHLVRGRDDFRVHRIGALGRDQIGDFRDRVYVRGFKLPLQQRAGAVDAGIGELRRAA